MYYKLGEQKKGRDTAEDLIRLFKEKLVWFSTFNEEDFDMVYEEFDLTFRYLYRGIVDQVRQYDNDREFVMEIQEEYNKTLGLFNHIFPQESEEKDLKE
jgi:hypothetical protein